MAVYLSGARASWACGQGQFYLLSAAAVRRQGIPRMRVSSEECGLAKSDFQELFYSGVVHSVACRPFQDCSCV